MNIRDLQVNFGWALRCAPEVDLYSVSNPIRFVIKQKLGRPINRLNINLDLVDSVFANITESDADLWTFGNI